MSADDKIHSVVLMIIYSKKNYSAQLFYFPFLVVYLIPSNILRGARV